MLKEPFTDPPQTPPYDGKTPSQGGAFSDSSCPPSLSRCFYRDREGVRGRVFNQIESRMNMSSSKFNKTSNRTNSRKISGKLAISRRDPFG